MGKKVSSKIVQFALNVFNFAIQQKKEKKNLNFSSKRLPRSASHSNYNRQTNAEQTKVFKQNRHDSNENRLTKRENTCATFKLCRVAFLCILNVSVKIKLDKYIHLPKLKCHEHKVDKMKNKNSTSHTFKIESLRELYAEHCIPMCNEKNDPIL